ncbi:MAG: hypothetical protein PHV34_14005 [Verrucomicrobiae bacterium]|nr:hypothetical protein [Verrucomicrobiae bacterium]
MQPPIRQILLINAALFLMLLLQTVQSFALHLILDLALLVWFSLIAACLFRR